MYKKFPEDGTPHELVDMELIDLTKGAARDIAGTFISFIVDTYLETGEANHKFTVVFNPEQDSPGSGQMVFINISIDDNFS